MSAAAAITAASTVDNKSSRKPKFLKKKEKKPKEERPSDATKLGCGALFSCAVRRRDPNKAPKEKKKKNEEQEEDEDKEEVNEAVEKKETGTENAEKKAGKIKTGKTKYGKVELDNAANHEMWQNIVNKSLVGTTLLTKAALVNMNTGGIFACNPSTFTPTIEQAQLLRAGIQNPGHLASPGIQVAEETFNYSSGAPGEYVYGENMAAETGVCVHVTKTALLIGIYDKNPDSARGLCKDIAEYISDQGL